MSNAPAYSIEDFLLRRAQQAAVLLTPDIWDCYRERLGDDTLHFDEDRASWCVFGYDDVMQVIQDSATFSSQRAPNPDGTLNPITSGGILGMDPPRHHQLRALIAHAFTPRVIAQMEPRITQIVDDLLDAAQDKSEMDIVDDLAFPLPVIVIAEMMGVPAEDRALFRQWSSDFVGPDYAVRVATGQKIAGYFQSLIAQRSQEPTDDLISALVHGEVAGEKLPQSDILGTCLLLLVAGHETTTGLISNAVVCLDDAPDAQRFLVEHPSVIPQALEEVLRYRGVVHTLTRVATVDAELRGQSIKAGDLVLPFFAAADLDERQFPEAHHFNILRSPNRHLGFGHGIHFCLGAPLARLEAKIALGALLRRFPAMQRNREVPLTLKPSSFIYGVQHVPVTLSN